MTVMMVMRVAATARRRCAAAAPSLRHCLSSEATDHAPVLSVDRSGLFQTQEHTHAAKSDETSMAKHIRSIIRFRGGPITVADYMEEVLTNPVAGFYAHRDVFGSAGSFVTAPDISQMFGEMVGVWSMCLWEQMGKPEKVQLVELGPGRGTLMKDLLRSTAKFEEFRKAISIHLVECSAALRKVQRQALQCVVEKPLTEASDGKQYSDEDVSRRTQISGATVSWHLDLKQVPRGVPTIVIAQEFLDALPIHQFQKTPRGWCEKLIDVAEDSSQGFRFVLSPGPTAARKLYLPQRLKWASLEEQQNCQHIEVCPGALQLSQEIAKRVTEDSGGGIIIDYGEDKLVSDSLQAIRDHKFVNVLEEPGTADLSAYVDFAAIKKMVSESPGEATAFGPISQSQFLGFLGINLRLETLLKNATDEQAEALQLGYWRLVGDDGPPPWLDEEDEGYKVKGMGNRYKVLAIANSKLGAPVCFQ